MIGNPEDLVTNVPDEMLDEAWAQKLSVSEMQTLLRCTQKHEYAYRRGLTSIDTPSYLTKGSFLHMMMEHLLLASAQGQELDISVLSMEVQQQLIQERGATVTEPDRLGVVAQLKDYFAHMQNKGVGIHAVEQEYLVDMPLPYEAEHHLYLHALIDVTQRDSSGQLWVVEHKTASRAWAMGQHQFDLQAPLYIRLVEAVYGERPAGVLYNFFYPAKWEQKVLYYDDDHIDGVLDTTYRALLLRNSGIVLRQPHWGCNDCWFKDICFAEMVGQDASHLIGTKYQVDEDRAARFQEE